MRFIVTILLTSTLLIGCISTAKISDFSQTAASIDFNNLSKEFKLVKTPFWTSSTSNEYYFEKETNISENQLVEVIKTSLNSCNYHVVISNIESQCLLGKRGMVANEWNSITGIYYKVLTGKIQVYVSTKITQDITGGWSENRAKKVGQRIEQGISRN